MPRRDDSGSALVQEALRGLREKLWRPAPPNDEVRRQLNLPMQRLTNEDNGNITIVQGTQGELDVNWEDPQQLQAVLMSIIESFYRNHPGRNPDFITVVTTFSVDSPAAFYMPLANDVRGIGYRNTGRGDDTFNYVGGDLALDGVIFLNNYRGYLGENEPIGRLTFNQELGHRWGSFVAFESGGRDSLEMLGRDCSHWSFFLDSANSAMEGNRWDDNGNGTFDSETSVFDFGYSPLDRYLMGFAPAAAVAPWFLITDAGGWSCAQPYRNGEVNPSYYPPAPLLGQGDVRIQGSRVDITIEDVIAAEGARRPAYLDAPKEWSMAFILAAKENDTINDRTVAQVEALRLQWERQWEEDATEPGYPSPDLVTTADGIEEPVEPPVGSAGLGDSCGAFSDCDPDATSRCVGTNTGVGVCTRTCDAPADCPNNFCCVPSAPGELQDRFDWYCLRKTSATCEDFGRVEPPVGGDGSGGAGGAGPAGGEGGEPVAADDTPPAAGGTPTPVEEDAGVSVNPADAALVGADPGEGAVVTKSGGGGSGCQTVPGRVAGSAGLSNRGALALGLSAFAMLGLRRRRRA